MNSTWMYKPAYKIWLENCLRGPEAFLIVWDHGEAVMSLVSKPLGALHMSYTPVISLISISSNDNIIYPIWCLFPSEPISSSASNSSNSSSDVAASTNSRISSTVSRHLRYFAYALEELMQSINKKSHSRVNYKNSSCNSTRGRLWVRAGTLELYVLS